MQKWAKGKQAKNSFCTSQAYAQFLQTTRRYLSNLNISAWVGLNLLAVVVPKKGLVFICMLPGV
jgi:hypothetical protein